jgi:hypothetical protein
MLWYNQQTWKLQKFNAYEQPGIFSNTGSLILDVSTKNKVFFLCWSIETLPSVSPWISAAVKTAKIKPPVKMSWVTVDFVFAAY